MWPLALYTWSKQYVSTNGQYLNVHFWEKMIAIISRLVIFQKLNKMGGLRVAHNNNNRHSRILLVGSNQYWLAIEF